MGAVEGTAQRLPSGPRLGSKDRARSHAAYHLTGQVGRRQLPGHLLRDSRVQKPHAPRCYKS